jgi:methionyl aminopeptidase
MPIEVKSPAELAKMRVAGRHVAEVLQILAEQVRPGLVVSQLDETVRQEYARRRLVPTFLHYQTRAKQPPYPATVCVSVNAQIVHGIPGNRVLQDGDVVSIDLGATYQGFVGDSAITVPCGSVSDEAANLIAVTEAALWEGIGTVRNGCQVGDIGQAVECLAERHNMGVIREFCGHGVGRRMHEEPEVPNYGRRGTGRRLGTGMVIAIEPMLTLGGWRTRWDPDGWTIWTADGSLAAHFEHTVAVTPDGFEVLTRVDERN